MDDRRRRRLGLVRGEPLADFLDQRQLAGLVDLPEAAEPAKLAIEVTGRLAEPVEAAGGPVHGVHLRERVDELLGDPPALVRSVERIGHGSRDHRPLEILHHVEGNAEHRLVVARVEHARRANVGLLHG